MPLDHTLSRFSIAVSVRSAGRPVLSLSMRAILLALCTLFVSPPTNAQSDESCYAQGSPCHVDSRLDMVGTDKASLQAFLGALKTAVREKDRPGIAKLISYPLRVNGDKKTVTYKSPAALLAAFDRVFTPEVLSVIERAAYEGLFVNIDGIMLGDGEIWCKAVSGAVFIKTVNLPPLFPSR